MPIKTIEIPTEYAAIAAKLHQLIHLGPAVPWSLHFEQRPAGHPPSAISHQPAAGEVIALVLQLNPNTASPVLPDWLGSLHSIELCVIPRTALHEILTGRRSLPLGEVSLRVIQSLAGLRLRAGEIQHCTLPLPRLQVEVDWLPDPVTTGLTANPDRSFTLHLQGQRVKRATFDVRITF